MAYDPNEPRDKNGQWTGGDASSAIKKAAGDNEQPKDFYNSRKVILVGKKSNLKKDMDERYKTKISADKKNGGITDYYDKEEHFATLYDNGGNLEIRHDGTLNEYGWRKK